MISTTKWVRVTRRNPCPICDRPDWCGVSSDGQVVHCMRVESDKRTEAGGWIHRLDQPVNVVVPPKRKERPALNFDHLTRFSKDVGRFAKDLGVSDSFLRRLGCFVFKGVLAFPMKDTKGKVCGIQYRAIGGRKWSETGSRLGLFRDTHVLDKKRLVVVEGASDTAAAMTALPDEWIVGRPGCMNCVEEVQKLLNKSIQLVIVADRDKDKIRPDGTTWNPGMDGAAWLAEKCLESASSIKIVRPSGCKDVREWLATGRLNPKCFHDLVVQANYYETI